MNNQVTETEKILKEFCSILGRSVKLQVEVPEGTFAFDHKADTLRPAASITKIVICIAVEKLIANKKINGSDMVTVGSLIRDDFGPSVLKVLHPNHKFSINELIGLCMSSSDPYASFFLGSLLTINLIQETLNEINCLHTSIVLGDGIRSPITSGNTTANEALSILKAGENEYTAPMTARGLRSSILNSRIPIGIQDTGTLISHKTGTLLGVAHDVATITCSTGTVRIAFLSENQSDTLQTGYEMGICVNKILKIFNLSVKNSKSFN
jgi:beta-lactamase class A